MDDKEAAERLLNRTLDLFRLPPPMKPSQWADKYRRLSSESSSKRGYWRSLPFQVEPMDSVKDERVESIVLMFASQVGGKTEILNNLVGYYIDQVPSPMLVVQPTISFAESWSKDRLSPAIRDTPVLRDKVQDPRSRDSGNTILHKTFPGGHLTAVGANAPTDLAGRPIRVLLCDEVDRYPASAGSEGDPIRLAENRTTTFWDAVKVYTSTPTVKGQSRIEAAWELTDKRHWFCPCPECGAHQTLKWAQVKWQFTDDDGTVTKDPEVAVYECEQCQARLDDKQRVDMIKAGEWRATAPFRGKRGYHLNGIYNVFRHQKGFKNRLHQMVSTFLDAKAEGEQALKTWINTFLAETWEESGEKLEAIEVYERSEKYGPTLPSGALVLTAGLDVQVDRIEGELVGYGIGEESWGISVARIFGNPENEEVWREVDEWLLREYEHPAGPRLKCACACIDSGYKPRMVYNFTGPRTSRRVFATKGSSSPGMPLVSRPRKSSVMETPLFTIGTDTAKEIIYSRLKKRTYGPRYCHFPLGYGYDEEFFHQLTAEKLTTVFRRGYPVRQWVKIRERNEALDCRVNSLAALDLLNPDWTKLAKNLAVRTKGAVNTEEQEEEQPLPGGKSANAPRIQNRWVGKWR